MKTYKMTIAYDGTAYNGWQKQGNTNRTIQEKLETLLSRLLEQNIEVAGSGRTDAGVHAAAQVCSFHAETNMSTHQLKSRINSYLPEDIVLLSLDVAEPRFHARLNAKKKTYLYRIQLSREPDVFTRRYSWHPERLPSPEKMYAAVPLLCGKHDFAAFSSVRNSKKSTIRTLYSIKFEIVNQELQIFFTGDGFLYNMVRILVGTLLEIGWGDRDIQTIPALLNGGSRADAGFTAPAKGLTLLNVEYDP